ncbi:hypothetical protein ACFS07_13365 [Undibacterium arcticum]
MADLTDVGSALVALIAQTVYPNGTGQASVANTGVRIYQGWPNPQQLDADLKLGICHVSVYPRTEERNVTRYSKDWQQLSVNTPTLTLTISGQTVTVGGTVPPGEQSAKRDGVGQQAALHLCGAGGRYADEHRHGIGDADRRGDSSAPAARGRSLRCRPLPESTQFGWA